MHRPLITLTTDFGTQDGYVGAMIGVILASCPDARIEHITHDVPPQDVAAGAHALATAAPFFPPDTIHIGVVDPGVGTSRRAVAASAGAHRLVGPDNGLLALAAERLARDVPPRFVEITAAIVLRHDLSHTFHGRDLFAPAAAALANGLPLDALGADVHDPTALDHDQVEEEGEALVGRIAHIDRFGNLITNIPAWRVAASHAVRASFPDHPEAPTIEGLSTCYGAAPPGALLLLTDSCGYLEVALSLGSAARALGLQRGARLRIDRAAP